MNAIRKAYLDPTTGYISSQKLARKLGIKKSKVDEVLNKMENVKLFRRPPVAKVYPKIISTGKNVKVQADLIFCDKIGLGVYDNYKYILSYIDVYSRKAVCIPITNKRGRTIVEALKKVWKELRAPSMFLETDLGTEFSNKEVKDFLRKNKTKLRVSVFAPHIESFNKTIERMLIKSITALKTKNWVKLLPIIVKNYNNTFHSSIKMTPNDAYENGDVVEEMRVKNSTPKFKVGDKVRVCTSKNKKDISPTVRSQWSKEKATINKVYMSVNGVYGYEIIWGSLGSRSLHLVPESLLQRG